MCRPELRDLFIPGFVSSTRPLIPVDVIRRRKRTANCGLAARGSQAARLPRPPPWEHGRREGERKTRDGRRIGTTSAGQGEHRGEFAPRDSAGARWPSTSTLGADDHEWNSTRDGRTEFREAGARCHGLVVSVIERTGDFGKILAGELAAVVAMAVAAGYRGQADGWPAPSRRSYQAPGAGGVPACALRFKSRFSDPPRWAESHLLGSACGRHSAWHSARLSKRLPLPPQPV